MSKNTVYDCTMIEQLIRLSDAKIFGTAHSNSQRYNL